MIHACQLKPGPGSLKERIPLPAAPPPSSGSSPQARNHLAGHTLANAGWSITQLRDVLTPLSGRETTGCGTNPLNGVLDAQVPESGRTVDAATNYRVSIGAEHHRTDGNGAASEGLAERAGLCRVDNVPQPDCAAVVAAGQRVPIRTERHRDDGTASQGLAESAGDAQDRRYPRVGPRHC